MTFRVMPEVQLRVDSAYPGDQGGGKARLDPETMLALRISPGDLVLVEGKRKTVAKVWRALVEDWNQHKIRIDNFTRMNAGIAIGDTVRVSSIPDEIEATRVVLAPPEDLPKKIPIGNNPHVVNGLIDFPVTKNDMIPIMLGLPFIQPQMVAFKVVDIEPETAVIITKNTEIVFSDKPAAGFEGVKRFSYEDIGGLKDELQRVRETIELPMRHPELFQALGIEPPKGVLLYGPPGTGKTLIAKAVASESGAHFISIAGPEVISKYYGESEQRLREVFEEARENSPAIIFIDELDSIAPRREDVTGEVERRVVAQLLTMMDGLEERGQVVVIGATNRVDAIDPALRRPGRFDREIEIGVPGEKDRKEILSIHTQGMPFEGSAQLKQNKRLLIKKGEQLNSIQETIKKLKEYHGLIIELKNLENEVKTAELESSKSQTPSAFDIRNKYHDSDISRIKQIKENIRQKNAELEEFEKKYHKLDAEYEDNLLKFSTELTQIKEEISKLEEEIKKIEIEIKKTRNKLIEELAIKTTGFVGADLSALARESAIRALRRQLPNIDVEKSEIAEEQLDELEVKSNAFWEAAREITPSAMREVMLEVSHVKWEDIGGLESAKEEVREAVEYPLTDRERFENLGIRPPRGVLLYGPPGTGKTLIAKAVANESGANFIAIRGPQLLSKWVGESERAVREVFRKARQVSPAIIFFDEIDALAPARGSGSDSHVIESVLNQLLTEMDGLEELKDVVVMGATNRPDIVDPALLRPGRFDRLVYIGEPTLEDRKKILRIHTQKMPITGSALEEVIHAFEGYDASGIEDTFKKIGKKKHLSATELKSHLAPLTEKKDVLSLAERRKKVIDLIAENHLTFTDPVRENLVADIAKETEGYAGSDLESLCREAGMLALREKAVSITGKHFEKARVKVHPTMNERLREYYKRIQDHFKGGLPTQVQPPEYQ